MFCDFTLHSGAGASGLEDPKNKEATMNQSLDVMWSLLFEPEVPGQH